MMSTQLILPIVLPISSTSTMTSGFVPLRSKRRTSSSISERMKISFTIMRSSSKLRPSLKIWQKWKSFLISVPSRFAREIAVQNICVRSCGWKWIPLLNWIIYLPKAASFHSCGLLIGSPILCGENMRMVEATLMRLCSRFWMNHSCFFSLYSYTFCRSQALSWYWLIITLLIAW